MSESIPLNAAVDEKSGDSNTKNNGTDIISTLPESIAILILCLLPTKDAVRTSVLSKDWENKWTNINDIDIVDSELFTYSPTRKQNFCNFVDKILRLCPVKRFRLKCWQDYDRDQMTKWISNVSRENVESIEMTCDYMDNGISSSFMDYTDMVIPRCLIDSTSLKNLKLEFRCTFRVHFTNWISYLTKLYLGKVCIVNELFPNNRQLIFTFPVLKSLELGNCEWLNLELVDINAPALKTFKSWCSSENAGSYQIKICGATLATFEASSYLLENIVLSESSVEFAVVGYKDRGVYIFNRHNGLQARMSLKRFSGLKRLKISTSIFEVLCRTDGELPLPIFDGLKQLEFGILGSMDAFLELLYAAPSIETLVLNVGRCPNRIQYDSGSAPPCVVSHLKEVEFKCFHGYPRQIHLAEYFLKNALNLKKMSGLVRRKSEENPDENNFWVILKRTFDNGDFEVGKDIKSMDDFEKAFGGEKM